MLLTIIVQIRKCWVVQRNTVKNSYELYLDITNILVVFAQIRYSTEVFDITKKFLQSLGTSLNRGSTVYK